MCLLKWVLRQEPPVTQKFVVSIAISGNFPHFEISVRAFVTQFSMLRPLACLRSVDRLRR